MATQWQIGDRIENRWEIYKTLKGGMGIAQTEEKKAVEAGYWNNFRFDPRLADEGKNPFTLDSKAPTASYQDFIMGEVRYNSLSRAFPDRAKELFAKSEQDAKNKLESLVNRVNSGGGQSTL